MVNRRRRRTPLIVNRTMRTATRVNGGDTGWEGAPACARTRATSCDGPRDTTRALAKIALAGAWLLVWVAGWPRDAAADGAPRVRLRAGSRIEVRATREAGEVLLSGTVVDDGARPVVGVRVGLSLARAADPGHPIALLAIRPEPCDPSAADPEVQGDDRIVLTADGVARFCVAVALTTDRYIVHVESRASALVDGAATDLTFDLARSPVALRFAPERSSLSLDDETTSLSVVASIDAEKGGVTTPAAGLALSLSNETGMRLGSATTDRSGLARFEVAGAHLGPPGPGELRVSFAGDSRTGPASETLRVERRARVELGAPEANLGRLPAGSPEDGIGLRIVASLPCASHGCVASPGGMVEARIPSQGVVGAAPLAAGETRLVISFAAPTSDGPAAASRRDVLSTDVPITVAYIPDAPWFQPGSALVLTQPVRGPSPWKKLPLVLAAAAVVAWLALTRSSVRPRSRPAPARVAGLSPTASIALIRAEPARSRESRESRQKGWSGRVSDAHEGVAIAQARISIERRDFEQIHVVAETSSSASGEFALGHVEARAGDELVVDGPRHAMIRRPLPPSGELAVALVLRRRALLDRLVAWARRQGPPYGMLPDASPGHVRTAAALAGREDGVARWATAVEQAAYGDTVVDERAEADVDRLAPPGAGGPPPERVARTR